ncbi:hypothetical protein JZ751_016053 [Albula glossodonta]|uniref:Uncharacterized protein n=1 Tax=Albula glossodonta TaxID=121402 RepID=A0A8T2NSS9_9TELE|nr:hypothetical protein JZ751_016053 [Albula glossodonta]
MDLVPTECWVQIDRSSDHPPPFLHSSMSPGLQEEERVSRGVVRAKQVGSKSDENDCTEGSREEARSVHSNHRGVEVQKGLYWFGWDSRGGRRKARPEGASLPARPSSLPKAEVWAPLPDSARLSLLALVCLSKEADPDGPGALVCRTSPLPDPFSTVYV